MSHLIFDRRDWKFLLHDVLNFQTLLQLPQFEDWDVAMFDEAIDVAVRFAVEKVAPVNAIGDREGCSVSGGRVTSPAAYTSVWHDYRAQGYVAPTHSMELGGSGLPFTIAAVLTEAFSAACQSLHMYGGLTAGSGHLIESFGTERLVNLFCPKMYGGEWGGTMCLTEPQAGSAVGDLTTSATPLDVEAGLYEIEGSKIFISGGDASFYENVVHLVLARIKGDPEGTRGISLFAVPRLWVNDDGSLGAFNNVNVTGIEHKLGINGSATCQVAFGDGAPSRGYLIGQPCQGLPYMFQMMNEARIACGIQGIALANASYQQALGYARDRKQGPSLQDLNGKSIEIINHPDVRRNLMIMKAYSEGTRALMAQAAMWSDEAMYGTDEIAKTRAQDLLELATPVVKAYSTDKGFKCTELGVQIFGGYGYTQEYPVEQYLRDCKIASIYEGTNGIQALDLLGRKMRMKGGALFMTYVMELGGFLEANKATPGLEKAFDALQRAQTTLGEVAFWLASTGKSDRAQAMLQASPFLDLMGDLMVGHQLLRSAVVAQKKLVAKVGTHTPSQEQKLADTEVAFLAGKIETARFFANENLVLAPGKARVMMSGETAALDIVFA